MNKKVKIAALFTALAVSVTAFAACGKDKGGDNGGTSVATDNWTPANFSEVFVTDYVSDGKYKPVTATKLNEYTGYNLDVTFSPDSAINDRVVTLFTKTVDGFTEYKVYNTMLGREILSVKSDKDYFYSVEAVSDYRAVYAVKCEKYNNSTYDTEYSYYSLDGQLLGTAGSIDWLYLSSDNKTGVFYVKKGSVETRYELDMTTGETTLFQEKSNDKGLKGVTVEYDCEGKKFDYVVEDGSVYVYQKGSAKIVGRCMYDGDDSVTVNIFANETLLIQSSRYTVGGDYDYIELINGKLAKYKLDSYVYNPETNEKKEVKLNFLVNLINNSFISKNYTAVFKSSVENVASVQEISADKFLKDSQRYVVLGNDLTVKGVLDDYVPDQKGLPMLVSDNLFKVSADSTYYLDETGKVVGKLPDNNFYKLSENFIRTSEAVYNLTNLERVYDITGAESFNEFDGSVFVSVSGNLKKFILLNPDFKTAKTLYSGRDVQGNVLSLNEGVCTLAIFADEKCTFIGYNNAGDKLFEVKMLNYDCEYYPIGDIGNECGIYYINEADEEGNVTRVYYLLKK